MSRHTIRQVIAPSTAAALILLLAAGPASARQEAGPATAPASDKNTSHCSLERVGTQYVRCDNLTGNGASAPGWLPSGSVRTAVALGAVALVSDSAAPSVTSVRNSLEWRRHGL